MSESGNFQEKFKSVISQKLSTFVHTYVVCTLLHFRQEYVELQVTLYNVHNSNIIVKQNETSLHQIRK